MSHIVVWSPHALECVRHLYNFLAGKDIDAAKAAATRIMQHAELLEKFPQAGRPADDLEAEHRELLIPFGGAGYVLLYHFAESGDTLTILAIRHQKDVGY
ncbi:type II toxin-antitoxin system RelE/ParE family toxin [Desulfovibrio sp. OttesenSCG-928-I05]|nr:type II toxin-antitoxin system RelE/ParE family toxin [Desulfovibrio sp. OttesenSCG-928-I05]